MFRLDHVTVAGAALEPLRRALAAVGIATVYGGTHQDGATEMAMVSFPDGSYLELIALHPDATANAAGNHPWSRFLTGNAGPCAWAVSTGDLESEAGRLRACGIAVGEALANGRDRTDGVRLEWRTAAPGAGAAGSFFPFLIQDVTARDLRAFPKSAPDNRDFRGISRVVLAVRSIDSAIARYRQAYGTAPSAKQDDAAFGAHLAVPGAAPVVFAQPLASDSWLAARLDRFGESPCAILLEAAGPWRSGAAAESRWFDTRIGWFDSGVLGWRLGWCG